MELTETHHFAAAADAVIDVLATEDAVLARYEGMGHRDVEVQRIDRDDGTLTVVSRRVVEVDLPGFARKVLQPTNTMAQTDAWVKGPDGWTGTFDVAVAGAPVQLSGTMRLVDATAGSDYEVTLTMNVKVPLVGGKIADWIGKNDALTTLQAEFAATDAWLADNPT
jgi:Protein of unknown function (DUF2505)